MHLLRISLTLASAAASLNPDDAGLFGLMLPTLGARADASFATTGHL